MPTESPLELGARILSVLETGRRESTYKLVTLIALVQHCLEVPPIDDSAPLGVDIRSLAARVTDLYRPSLRPFRDDYPLLQVKSGSRKSPPRSGLLPSVGHADMNWKPGLDQALPDMSSVAQQLAQQPLTHLQNDGKPGQGSDFIYDASWLHKKINRKELVAHNWSIELFPGVATQLALLAPLLLPAIERLWVLELQRFNPTVFEAEVEDYLFGRRRRAVAGLARQLSSMQGDRCFYCASRLLPEQTQVDHVLPWSRCAFDGLANLVAADNACNQDKSSALPDPFYVTKALRRNGLDQISDSTKWRPGVGRDRLLAVTRGQYRFLPDGYRLWRPHGADLRMNDHVRGAILLRSDGWQSS